MKTWIKVDLIKDYLTAHKMSKAEFCRRAGVSRGVLEKVLTDAKNIRIDSVVKVFNFIGAKSIFNSLIE